MLFLVNLASFWLLSALFFILDVYFHSTFSKYKCIPLPREKIIALYKQALPIVIRNQLVLVFYLVVFEYFHHENKEDEILIVIAKLTSLTLILAVLFTATHKAFHKYAYWIHKTHHIYTTSLSLVSEFNHILETLFNYGYTYLVIFAFHFSYNQVCFIICAINLDNSLNHCGYKFRSKTRHHDLHHRKSTVNFSSEKWMDKILNTYENSDLHEVFIVN